MQLEQTQSVEHAPIPRFLDEGERLKRQFKILEAIAHVLEFGGWSGRDASEYLRSIFMDDSSKDYIGGKLRTLTQSTDDSTVREVDKFINETTKWKEDDPPVVVPAVLAFLVPKEGKVKDGQPTLH